MNTNENYDGDDDAAVEAALDCAYAFIRSIPVEEIALIKAYTESDAADEARCKWHNALNAHLTAMGHQEMESGLDITELIENADGGPYDL